ncbi:MULTISPECIES: NADH-quinone oxidoreductase subunit C [Dehalobacter]|jgi:NADH (or F420H2) dehydrogenase, subunit C|uniref:NADH-quinone oxidoreductase subunit C n=1 Tax=Dehalobacter restrictus TaxID=55583 RepID=A0A857DHN7_9FIRM|nr:MULTISPECIES: NADH-quinone oxidoreductase subunit C [Dehalobacter]AFV03316.1 NADH-ubiquinone oxidoreductase chain C [Dehalobacter sp. DCA]AFV06304.1 NADH-ubiquinone oxidoreductase chain C [Dehalobacter sp. CF]EQB20049.1 NADH-ubiquinone oxidoreductase chain C [Dehalobacter sp. UNSWDHB]QHA00019.1 NADH-quinone oxidoreductase subunit C [Dehalobacter restrictus]
MDKKIDRQALVAFLNEKMDAQAEVFEDNTEGSIKVSRLKLGETMQELRENPQYKFDVLMNLSSVDYPENFTVIYHLFSIAHKHYLTVKVEITKENPCWVPSVSSVWKAAQVHEREVFDLMGILFNDHPDLRRILLPEDFAGHPLRKDFTQQAD